MITSGKPFLSILIPTYNRAAYLNRCLKSIRTYEQNDIEIIVQDNCSPDNTSEVVNSFNDHRIKYYRNERNIGGVWNAINIIEKAQGEYLFYLTDDDFLFPGAIDNVLKYISAYQPVAFTSDIIVYVESKHRVSYYDSCFDESLLLDKNDYAGIAKIFNSAHILTRVCFKKDDLDLDYLNKYGDNWYPQMLLIGYLASKGRLGYLAEPVGIHTWENEVFWGISPNDKDQLDIGYTNIILNLSRILERDQIKVIVKNYCLSSNCAPTPIIDFLTPSEFAYLKYQLYKKNIKQFIISFIGHIRNL